MGDKTKKLSSWADVAKAVDRAEADLAQRRSKAAPPKREAAPSVSAGDHIARLKRALSRQKERRAAERNG